MSDFVGTQTQLSDSQAGHAAAMGARALAQAQLQAAQSSLKSFDRSFRPEDRASVAQQAAQRGAVDAATAELTAANGRLVEAKASLASAAAAFAIFSDPRQSIQQLPDRSPFVLFPVRVETRFRAPAANGRASSPQLWVRIYPDDCSIDTFEQNFSAAELANAKLYWEAMWGAGGVEADERAAWRNLVAAHGSSRAGYLVDVYQPLNMSSKPVKASPSDEILVIPSTTALPTTEAAALSVYWKAIWLGSGSSSQQAAALAVLEASVGAARAADLVAGFQPFNLADTPTPPVAKSTVAVSVELLLFPNDPPTQQGSWSQAPQVRQFPDRFVVLGYADGIQTLEAIGAAVTLPLYVGPDPSVDASVDPNGAIHPDGPDLFVPEDLKWMVDFDAALAAGMALAIDLTLGQAAAGFDRLLVLGLQLSATDLSGKAALEELLRHHASSRSGFSIVTQGTPAHNTTGAGTGYTKRDDPDASFDDRKNAPLFTSTPDPLQKRDGQWLAETLGIDPALLTTIHGSGSLDQMQARAMQTALWPATLGYWMDKMLAPVFSDEIIEKTRDYFTRFVSGRGPAPAIRIGGQPYGILPTTAYSRIGWLSERNELRASSSTFLAGLYRTLRALDPDWTNMSASASFVGKDAPDPHQTLLDILGLHPSSVEFYSRYAEGIDELFNLQNFWGFGPEFFQALLALGLDAASLALLNNLGYSGTVKPDLLNHFFLKSAQQITNIIDDRPLAETNTIRAYTDDGRNYIQWLTDAAQVSLEAVQAEAGFSGDRSPESLLYLFLRHALMLGYNDFSYGLYRDAGFLSTVELASMKREPAFIHVAEPSASPSESRFAPLLRAESRITGSPTQKVSDYITENLAILFNHGELNAQVSAMQVLAKTSTSQLERLFAEHIDTCTFRFDAWLQGLVNFQLQTMRSSENGVNQQGSVGCYLGAYAWLEDLRPSQSRLQPPQIPPDVASSFPGEAPLLADPANGGYVHAPSLPQANTAAVLRSGYLANADAAHPGVMAVNLSSDRVRLALSLLEGIRNGQSLGALLGYRFERGLHDDHGIAEVDQFIYPMRKAFPLVADALTSTSTAPDVPIEAIEARNVLDGRKLITQIQTSGITEYPFGLSTLPAATAPAKDAISEEANALLDLYDAISDLALAEGVHQAVQGNFERIASTLDAYSTGNFPPEPEVIQTPVGGITLTQRVALHLQSGLTAPAGATPRAQVEPALDRWIGTTLPPLADMGCTITWTDPVSGVPSTQFVNLGDLAVSPIDLLDLIRPENTQAMTELDDRIIAHALKTFAPRPDAAILIQYMVGAAGKFSVFEAGALVAALKSLLARARPLRATDSKLQNNASTTDNDSASIDPTRVTSLQIAMAALGTDIKAELTPLQALVSDPITNRNAIVSKIDLTMDTAATLLSRAASFRVASSGWGFLYAWRRSAFVDLLAQISLLFARWNSKVTEATAALAQYDLLPAAVSDADRFKTLQAIESQISAVLDPLPSSPAVLRGVAGAKLAQLVIARDHVHLVLSTSDASFANLLAAATAIPTTTFDSQPFDLSGFGDRAITLAQDIVTNYIGHLAAINESLATATTQLAAASSATSAAGKIDALSAAAKALLGPDVTIIPEFSLDASQGAEWSNAYAASTSGQLLAYLRDTLKVDFAVDEWLLGVARVRPALHAWESLVNLAAAWNSADLDLTPVQFPFESAATWLGMQFPPDQLPTSDHLLYTAHFAKPFNATEPQCGLLLDEWTEVLPAADRNTGLAFQYNRPDNEPPQCILVVTPASATGTWQWSDVVGALNETLDLAKKRAVEPSFMDNTPYAPLLPATVMAATLYGISISTNLAVANGALRTLETSPHA